MELVSKKFSEMTLDELYMILKWRSVIFIVEQDCVYQDLDDMDQDALHIWLKDGEELVAYARVLKANTYLDEIAIGRVITVRRGEGYGMQIFGHAIDAAVEKFGAGRIKIRAQLQAEKFYHKFGFKACGEAFMYEGLMHIDMLWEKP